MSVRPYDHAVKSGNEGDVVKHVALLAALDVVLKRWKAGVFHYADTFAGYARNVLGEGGAWTRGAGHVAGDPRLDDNPHTALWRRWYVPRSDMGGTAYPGSSLVVSDVASLHGVPLALALWDTSKTVVSDLRAAYGESAKVFERPARPGDEELDRADFVFVDPPDLDAWPAIRPCLEPARAGGTLVWLPLLREREAETQDRAADAQALGYAAQTVTWPSTSTTVGCTLLHRFRAAPPSDALRLSVAHVAALAGWRSNDLSC